MSAGSDGYGTGLMIVTLRQPGMASAKMQIAKGLAGAESRACRSVAGYFNEQATGPGVGCRPLHERCGHRVFRARALRPHMVRELNGRRARAGTRATEATEASIPAERILPVPAAYRLRVALLACAAPTVHLETGSLGPQAE